jgi:hypothetical protein
LLPPLLNPDPQWLWVGGGRAESGYASSLPRPPSASCRALASSRWPVVVQAGVVEEGRRKEQQVAGCG